jgi:hypothetical protein
VSGVSGHNTIVLYTTVEVEGKWCISLKKLPAITVNKEYLSLRKQIPDKTLFNEHLAVARGLIFVLWSLD